MPFSVTYTDQSNPLNTPIVVADESIDNTTSVTLVGRNYQGYGTHIANNFLHLLENFAGPDKPGSQSGKHPVKGQLWYDSANSQLMVNNDGTDVNWTPVGSVYKSAITPTTHNTGDVWVDTLNNQLNIYTGTKWIVVGPNYSEGTLSGLKVETIKDSTHADKNVVSFFAANKRIAILSDAEFTPQQAVSGYSKIYQGINLINSGDAVGQTTSAHRFHGTASNADSLGGSSKDTFMRIDKDNTINQNLFLSVSTVYLGNDRSLIVSGDQSSYLIQSDTNNKSLEIRLKDSTSATHSVYFKPNGNIGIGVVSPSYMLDIAGTLNSSGKISTSNTADVSSTSSSISTLGGLFVGKSTVISNNLSITDGVLTLDRLETGTSNPKGGAIIAPGISTHVFSTSGNGYVETIPPVYDIGSETNRFRRIYVKEFIGDVTGTVTGNLIGTVIGNITGTANGLTNSITMSISGDVSSGEVINFDGSTNVDFNTTISTTVIGDKPEILSTFDSDDVLVHRQYSSSAIGYISGTTLTVLIQKYGSIVVTDPIYDSTGDHIGTVSSNQAADQWSISYTGSHTGPYGNAITPVVLNFGDPALHKAKKSTFLSSTLIGGMMLFPGITEAVLDTTYNTGIVAPVLDSRYLVCNGATVSRLWYNELYNVLGPSFLVTGTLNFTLPNISAPAGYVYIIYCGVDAPQ